jgi:PPR repeat
MTAPHFGRGQSAASSSSSSSAQDIHDGTHSPPEEMSRVQEQVAARRLPEMTRFLDSLRQYDRNEGGAEIPDVSPQMLHEAILYWMSQPVRRIVQNKTGSDREALESALELIDWSHRHENERSGSEEGDSGVSSLFQSVADLSMLGRLLLLFVNVTNRMASPEEIQERLLQASHVYDVMEDWARASVSSSFALSSPAEFISVDLLLLRARAILWSRRVYYTDAISTRAFDASPLKRKGVCDSKQDEADTPFSAESIASILADLSDQALEHHEAFHGSDGAREALLSVYQSIIACYACLGDVERARDLLCRLEDVRPPLQVPIENYNFVLKAYTKRAQRRGEEGDVSATTNDLEECRKAALEFWQSNLNAPHLDRYHPVTMSTLLKLLSHDPLQAMSFLESIPEPTVVHYNSVLTSWAKWSRERMSFACQQAKDILIRMNERGIAPDRISYTAVMDTLLQSNDRNALDQVELLLEQSRQRTGDDSATSVNNQRECRPDTAMYIVLLRGLLQYHRRHAESQVKEDVCFRMQRILLKMFHETDVIVDTATYKLVLVAWAKSHSPIAGVNAAQLFKTMKESGVKPDLETLEYVLACLSIKVKSPEWALNQARAVREFALRHQLAETPWFFSRYLRVVSHAGQLDEAERLMTAMPSIDAESYYSVVEGHAKRQNGAPKADKLLQEWRGPPSLRMMKVVMTAWSHQKDHEAARACQRIDEIYEAAKAAVDGQPLAASFRDAYMKAISKRPNAPFVMEQVLTGMQRDYESTGRKGLKPNGSAFATVIVAWAGASPRINGAPERAQELLNRLDELSQSDVDFKPTLACYRGVISAWALSNHPESGRRATAVLDRLEQQTEIQPNRACYLLTLKAIGKSSDPNKAPSAYKMLQRMKADFARGNHRAEPSTDEYTTAIRAIGSTRGSPEQRMQAYSLAEKTVLDFVQNSPLRETLPPPHREDYEQLFLQYLWAAYKLLPAGANRNRVVQNFVKLCPEDVVALPSMQDALAKVVTVKSS